MTSGLGEKLMPVRVTTFRAECLARQTHPALMRFGKANKLPRLSQKEREAIIDLLHLCLYVDSHITLKEAEFIADTVERIGWDTQSSFSSYEVKSIAAARATNDSPAAKAEFLSEAAERLPSNASRTLALDLCKQLLAADGSIVENETVLLDDIRTALNNK